MLWLVNTDSDNLAFGQNPRFGVRPENTNRTENSVPQLKQGAHRQPLEGLAAQVKQNGPPIKNPKGIIIRGQLFKVSLA